MKEIIRYRLALIQYQISDKLPFLSALLKTDTGFCAHFKDAYLQFGKTEFKTLTKLPMLASLNPHNNELYWFPIGDTKSRIKLLKEAIKQKQL